ncbi:MAG: mercuric reductase [Elusimicrobia bacterium]|nr:mercuric reductase [Elusimicrobiota bacterium]
MNETIRVLPDDEHNRALASNAHPQGWINPNPAAKYHLVVVGGGTAGLVTAAGAAGLGAKVALVEKHLLGGDCLNVGCVPSKALIRASRAAADVRGAAEFGISVPLGWTADFPGIMERLRRLRAQLSSNDSAKRFKDLGVDIFLGEGRFVGPSSLEVAGSRLNFSKAVIATGARAARLPIPGLWESGALTNETVFSLTELPKRLVVIGAGPIGCELSQAFARFGARVSILEVSSQILGREDEDAARIVQAALKKDGVEIMTSCKISGVEARGGEKIVRLESEGRNMELTADAILVGVGRAPNVEGLELEAAGVEYDKRTGVKVDDRLRTANSRIFAAGDVCSPYKFTHAADAMARVAIQNALFAGRKKASSLVIPWCTYTDPEVAHVGLYEKEAHALGIKTNTFIQALKDVDRAVLDGQGEGFVKIHLRTGTDEILGATIVAAHAGEMIGELALAMTAKIGLKTIGATIHPYPTQAEAVKKTADAYNRSRLTPAAKRLLAFWLGRP